MLYEFKTNLSWDKAKEKALSYFKDNLGLEVTDNNEICLTFEGGGGYVKITSCIEEDDTRKVEVETREWDRRIKSFMKEF